MRERTVVVFWGDAITTEDSTHDSQAHRCTPRLTWQRQILLDGTIKRRSLCFLSEPALGGCGWAGTVAYCSLQSARSDTRGRAAFGCREPADLQSVFIRRLTMSPSRRSLKAVFISLNVRSDSMTSEIRLRKTRQTSEGRSRFCCLLRRRSLWQPTPIY